ncbi:hypothetical protein HAX54_001611 [Datura stramonium]|uniref:Uncharacterized protein n=1 Tax=Datura stramonium TaxID=4076 RepID=A0ABS8WQS5_DATST|nr:hypothetical protein [Datura stramonium]
MGWTSMFQHPRPANLGLVLELYANIFSLTRGRYHDTVDLRGKEIIVNKTTLCEVLGVPDHPIEPLNDFIDHSDYKAMRDLLYGPEMKPIEERDSQENLSARIHAMMEWRCRQVRMDFTTLDAQFPLFIISRQIIGGRVELLEDEDVNTAT